MQEATVAAAHRKLMGRHGEIRGLEAHGRSDQFEGRFGRMFRTLPPAQFDAGVLHDLAAAMTAEFEATPTPETEADDEENTGISAGYTRSEEHTSELQSQSNLVCRLLLEKKKKKTQKQKYYMYI